MPQIIGITGYTGFIGSYLFNYLKLRENTQVIGFNDDSFDDSVKLRAFAGQCDIILHFAAINRHPDDKVLYETNVGLVRKLVTAMESAGARPHVFLSSSIQEERDNPYGRSKKLGRELLSDWASRNGARFTGLVIPNVFGPFGLPFYNSVIATFSYQLTHGETPVIMTDNEIKLVFVDELASLIRRLIEDGNDDHFFVVEHTAAIKVSELLEKMMHFRSEYYDKGIIPPMKGSFERNLFNTFRSFIDYKTNYPFPVKQHTDNRGFFCELVRSYIPGQFSYSLTRPGITRGNHFHTRKIERFIVISGQAQINLRRIGTDEVLSFEIEGSQPAFIDIPVWYTHNIINSGEEDLITLFWINEFYDPDDPDTYFENV